MFEAYTLHHVGIVAPDLHDAEALMRLLGLVESYRGQVDTWKCLCIFTRSATGAVIEIVVPDGGPLARFNKGMGGVHHFAYSVDDIVTATKWCAARNLRMIEPEAIRGAGSFLCNFINPLDTRGVQIELVQPL